MGSSESKPAPPPPPPTVTPPSIPVRNDFTLSISTSSTCLECADESCKDGKPCRLAVAANKSASSVKVYRDRKSLDIRNAKNNSFYDAFLNIGKTVTAREFLLNLRQGKYTVLEGGNAIDVEASPSQFNTLMRSVDNIKGDIPTFDTIIKPNISQIRARELKTSYLSENKLTVVPNIPFEMSYNGKTFNVTKLSLFHPSPLRIENVQHDAVLTLNDPGDNPEFVVMIPVVSSSGTTPSTTFFSRISSAFAKVTLPNQDGSEETVATGSDWSISKLFNTMSDGVSIVDSFYTWTGVNTVNNVKTGRYIMMEKPMFISSGDLTELRNLPAITPTFGIPAVSDPVSYRKELCCKASGTTTRESFTVKEGFVTTPTDAFAYFAMLITGVIGILFAFMLAENSSTTDSIRDFFIGIGRLFSRQFDKLYGGVSIPGMNLNSNLTSSLQQAAKGNLNDITSSLQQAAKGKLGDFQETAKGNLNNLTSSLQQAVQLKNPPLSDSQEIPPALQNLASSFGVKVQ